MSTYVAVVGRRMSCQFTKLSPSLAKCVLPWSAVQFCIEPTNILNFSISKCDIYKVSSLPKFCVGSHLEL